MTTTIPTESQEQQKLIQWLKLKRLFYFAPINENNHSSLNRRVAVFQEVKARSMGKVKGTSDLIVMLPNKILFIELKKQGKILKSGKTSHSNSKVSKEQIAFIEKANKYPYAIAKVCYGYAHAIDFINENNN